MGRENIFHYTELRSDNLYVLHMFDQNEPLAHISLRPSRARSSWEAKVESVWGRGDIKHGLPEVLEGVHKRQ